MLKSNILLKIVAIALLFSNAFLIMFNCKELPELNGVGKIVYISVMTVIIILSLSFLFKIAKGINLATLLILYFQSVFNIVFLFMDPQGALQMSAAVGLTCLAIAAATLMVPSGTGGFELRKDILSWSIIVVCITLLSFVVYILDPKSADIVSVILTLSLLEELRKVYHYSTLTITNKALQYVTYVLAIIGLCIQFVMLTYLSVTLNNNDGIGKIIIFWTFSFVSLFSILFSGRLLFIFGSDKISELSKATWDMAYLSYFLLLAFTSEAFLSSNNGKILPLDIDGTLEALVIVDQLFVMLRYIIGSNSDNSIS